MMTRQVKVAARPDTEDHVLLLEQRENALATQKSTADKLAAEVGSLQSTTGRLQGKIAAEQEFEQKMAAAKARFSADEAEVLRDGDRFIIRLKKLAFPLGKANLTPQSLSLLAKVRNAVANLGPGRVTIEGHTDATGTKAKNRRLSEERAGAIKEYLQIQTPVTTDTVAIGLADSKPIASNKTKDDRAQNRRVDIIVEPAAITH